MTSLLDGHRIAPTFDQLNVFVAVVEAGGFSAAARTLNRQQSAISYTIATLEEQLGGLQLFDRSSRKPVLTEAGHAVLSDARRIAREVDGLRATVAGLRSGLEAEISVVIDSMLSEQVLVAVLTNFKAEFPTVGLRVAIETLGGVPANILDRSHQIGISGPLFYKVDGLEEEQVGSTSLLPVASPSHPLASYPAPISTKDARKYAQLVLTDRSKLSHGREFAVIAAESLRVSDILTKHCLILAGLGWGNLPEPLVKDDLAAGRLVHLPLAQWRRRPYALHAIHRTDAPPGPAARWFIKHVSQQTSW